MDSYLETERLTLRRFTADDAHLPIELDSDPAVMRYLPGGGEPTTPDEVRVPDLPSIPAGYEKWDDDFGLRRSCDLEVRLVWAATMTAKVASQKVMEKIGMTLAEHIPTPPDLQMCEGAERGGVLYRIDRDRWKLL